MACRRYFLVAALVLSSVILVGCAASTRSLKPSAQRGNAKTVASPSADIEIPQSLDKEAEAHAHYAAGIIHEIDEQPELALEEFSKAAANDPNNEMLLMEVSRRLVQRKQPEKALELLTKATARPDASGALFARLGFIYSQMGKIDEAIAANHIAIKKMPRSLSGYQNLCLNYLHQKRYDEALKALEQAAKQPDTDAEFLIDLAELYANFARQVPAQKETAHAAAVAVLKRASRLNLNSPQLRFKLADGFNLLGDTDSAAQIYLQLIKRYADLPMVRDNVRAKLTDLYLRGRDRRRAMEQLEAVVRDDPKNPQAHYFLGSLALEEKKYAEAVEYFSKTILLSQDFEPAYYDLAGAQININQPEQALATLEKAREKFSESFVNEFLAGLAYNEQKDYVAAIKHFTAAEIIARAAEPTRLNQFFYFQLGAAYERKGDYEQAETYFQKSLEKEPDFVEALNYLGYMWADRGVNLDKARELIEKALKAEPKNAAYLDSLGWVLFKLNEPTEALEQILKAVEVSKEPDATLYDHLGDVYAALSQMDKAREAWRKSLTVEPNDQVRKKLESPDGK